MRQPPILPPPNFSAGEGMIMMIPAQQRAPPGPPKNWNRRCAKGVGTATIILAVVAFVCNIGWFFFQDDVAFVGVGFWAGIPMFVSGLLLTIGGSSPNRCLVVSVLVASIVANLLGIGFLAVGGVQLNRTSYRSSYTSYSYSYYTTAILPSSVGIGMLYILIGLTGFGLLLTASILSCNSLCADCGRKESPYLTVAYIPQGLVMSADGSVMSASMYPSATASMQEMHQSPVMSFNFAPQGPMPCAPPPYSACAGTPSNANSYVAS